MVPDIFNFTKVSLGNESSRCKKWQTLKDGHHFDNDMHFQWAQLIHAIPKTWKNKVKQNLTKNESNKKC